jgi:adenylate cyclase
LLARPVYLDMTTPEPAIGSHPSEAEGFGSAREHRPTQRDLRICSGLVLFAYITGHFANHALGLISLAAAEQGLRIAVAVWQSPLGTLVLYGAVVVHVGLAFMAIYQHRTLRLPPIEWLRVAAGLGIPALLIGHAVDTRLALEAYGHPTDYAHVVWKLWHSGREGRQVALLVPGWLHGCLGLGMALSGRAWYSRARMALFGVALLLPVLAVLGFVSMLKEVTLLAQDPSWVATTLAPVSDVPHRPLVTVRDTLLALYWGAVVAVFVARLLRSVIEERRGSLVSIGYPGRTARVPRGWTVLEASRAHGIAHVSLCGGRARCSTCRVRVVFGQDDCPPPGDEERRTLARIHAAEGTRLACKLRPQGDVGVVPLVNAAARPSRDPARGPVEREIAVMLVVARWEQAGRSLLPHDLLHALDGLGGAVGEVTRAAGGMPIEFVGDRVTVLFGLDDPDVAEANRRALRAAAQLDLRLRKLRAQLQGEFGCDMQHVIGLHFGSTVVGRSGDPLTRTPIATGSAVDVVRQLLAAEAAGALRASPPAGARRVVVSRAVFVAAQREPSSAAWHELELLDGKRIEFARIDPGGALGDSEAPLRQGRRHREDYLAP